MTSEAFTQIVGAVFTIIGVIIALYIVPAIRTTIGEKNFATIVELIGIAVKSADQLFDISEYEAKKEYVENYILDAIDKHFNVKLTKEELDVLIEGEVQRLHHLNGIK